MFPVSVALFDQERDLIFVTWFFVVCTERKGWRLVGWSAEKRNAAENGMRLLTGNNP